MQKSSFVECSVLYWICDCYSSYQYYWRLSSRFDKKTLQLFVKCFSIRPQSKDKVKVAYVSVELTQSNNKARQKTIHVDNNPVNRLFVNSAKCWQTDVFGLKGNLIFCYEDTFESNKSYRQLICKRIQQSGQFLIESASIWLTKVN